jgi:hypothetical protein
MTIKSSGTLSLAEINAEFGRGYNLNAHRNIQWWLDNNSTGLFSSGSIGMNEFYGKRSTPVITTGSYYRSIEGAGSFQLPYFNQVNVEIWGGGGGGGSSGGYVAQAAGTSTVAMGPYYMEAYGGHPSQHVWDARRTNLGGGGPGYAVGGQFNAQGFSGGGGQYYTGGNGGGANFGGGGSAGSYWNQGLPGSGGEPGGGGGGAAYTDGRSGNFSASGGGGGGGYSSSIVYSAQVPWLSTINFTVGGAGYFNGGKGAIRFTWS